MMPGSVKDVWNSADMTNMNRRPPTAGMAGVKFSARNGQLWEGSKMSHIFWLRQSKGWNEGMNKGRKKGRKE